MQRKKLLILLLALFTIAFGLLATAASAFAASNEKVLWRFNYADGAGSNGSLVLDAAGNLYGTSEAGGSNYYGTVFQLAPGVDGTWTETILHSFGKDTDGSGPQSGVIFDEAGNLYGTTFVGGAKNAGTVFELTPKSDGSWHESILYSFDGRDGYLPRAGVILDPAGNLYGTTQFGGAHYGTKCGAIGCGTVFQLKRGENGQWTEQVLHSFKGKDGSSVYAGLTIDAAGNLYGAAALGGRHSCRTGHGCGLVIRHAIAPLSRGAAPSSNLSLARTASGRKSCCVPFTWEGSHLAV
jgi:uncharacterized repeat protein (TIGR03803 family)